MSTIKQAYEDKNYFDKAHYEAMRQSDKMKIWPSDTVAGVKRLRPHIHAEMIKAWADGAQIEFKMANGGWRLMDCRVTWSENNEYRIKPEYKPDTVELYKAHAGFKNGCVRIAEHWERDNLKLTFDGETGKLKSAEVI